ncbi:hypothetical protein HGB07_10135, partial [Candidatus Roizmanbacteria bacterium]|nr:hypothetical protein [Candidatus Roizmanbacteria bacterium]
VVAFVFLTGAPWWLNSDLGELKINYKLNQVIFFVFISSILIVTLIIACLVGYYQYTTKKRKKEKLEKKERELTKREKDLERTYAIKHRLHMITHEIRDQIVDVRSDKNKYPNIKLISQALCEKVKLYFSESIDCKDISIGVAIRIARKNTQNCKTEYVTVGRAGLSPGRDRGSVPLLSDEGLAKILQHDKGSQGMLVIYSLQKAIDAFVYTKQPNDTNFPDDIKSMMVAPINGWDGQQKRMLGILFVTSRRENTFGKKYTDSVGFIADALANLYSALVLP